MNEATSSTRLLSNVVGEDKPNLTIVYDHVDLRRKRFKWICGLTTVLLIAAVFVALLVGIIVGTGKDRSDQDCLTAGVCNTKILDYIDTSYDPCVDFYNYSCGNWPFLSADELKQKGSWGTIDSLHLDNYNHVVSLLSQRSTSSSTAIQKARLLYSACSDVVDIRAKAAGYLRDFLLDNGGWEDAGIEPAQSWNINTSLANDHFFGSSAFFSFDIEPDDFNSTVPVIKIMQNGLSLSSPELYNDTSGQDYIDLINTIYGVLVLINGTNASTLAYQIADVEMELAKGWLSRVNLENTTLVYNPMSLDELAALFNMDWVGYFNTIFSMAGIDYQFTGDSNVIVETVDYFEQANNLIQQLQVAPQVVVNYAKWQLLRSQLQYVQPFLSGVEVLLHQAHRLKVVSSDVSLVCAQLTDEAMSLAVGRLFVDELITDDMRSMINTTISDIEAAFIERVMEKDWLDDYTKGQCVDKVNAIARDIAYPDFIKIDSELDAFYESLNIEQSDDYLQMIPKAIRFGKVTKLSYYVKPVNRSTILFLVSPLTEVNAFYVAQFNEFVFLPGIMRVPFFAPNWPAYLNYGAIGTVTGHELTHGFDNQGQQYNKDGNRVQWWSDGSIANFTERTECFVEQYDSYRLQGYQINGELTLGENIADNGAIHTAFRAYKKLVSGGNTTTIRGHTLDQLFFISFAQLWCTQYTSEQLQLDILTDEHSPGPIRVLGALSNSEEFATAFSCSNGSRMNPAKKCELW